MDHALKVEQFYLHLKKQFLEVQDKRLREAAAYLLGQMELDTQTKKIILSNEEQLEIGDIRREVMRQKLGLKSFD